jgi:hypothetical protein
MYKYLLIFALTSWSANAQTASMFFYSYSAWDRLTDVARTAYVSGVMDSMIIFAASDPDMKWSRYYSHCVKRTTITSQQLTTSLRAYVASRPELQSGTVQVALISYLVDLCGTSPN